MLRSEKLRIRSDEQKDVRAHMHALFLQVSTVHRAFGGDSSLHSPSRLWLRYV